MKKILLSFALVAVLAGCERDEIDTFNLDHQMITFTGTRSAVTFSGIEPGGEAIAVIPIKIAGNVADYDRHARFEKPDNKAIDKEEEYTTLADDRWEFIDAIIPAGKLDGNLRVRVKYPWWEEDRYDEQDPPQLIEREDLFLNLVTADGGDFFKGVENRRNLLTISEKLVKPASWYQTSSDTAGMGEFSPAYYAFIIENTGFNEFAFRAGTVTQADGTVTPQWSTAQRTAFLRSLEGLIAERNERVGSPLRHDGGPVKGKRVVVGLNEDDYANASKYPYED